MLTLAIETASNVGSLALFKDKKAVDSRQWSREGSHSESLTAAFSEILLARKIEPHQIDRLAVDVGPGSFTGLRVAVNFARAMGYALHKPIFNISSLALLASQAAAFVTNEPIRVFEYGFRDILYTAEYSRVGDQLIETSPPTAQTFVEALNRIEKKILVVGSGYAKLAPLLTAEKEKHIVRSPKIRDFALAIDFSETFALSPTLDLSFEKSESLGLGRLTDWIHTIPLYIRASEAEEKLRLGVLKRP